ncbi:MAG TPA: hypothetical protein VHB02_16410 [Acidimicrobiales bacterium]|nr:hypothetical protein [Acidimicrobiales bacterium]
MTPPAAAAARAANTATATAARATRAADAAIAATQARRAPDHREAPDRRPPLRVVPRRRARRWPVVLSVAMVGGSLLSVVIGHAMLAQGQVRLSAAQAALSAEQSVHHQAVLGAAKLETPSRIVAKARQQGMVPPAQTNQLPRVSLDTPLATPTVSPSTTTTAPATSGSSGATTGASSAGSTSGR